jgi:nucleoid DNA-binding protein
MFSLLHQYLVNSSNVVLPGIGTLQFANSPAQTVNGRILSPKQTLVLLAEKENDSEVGKLMAFLSNKLDMPEMQAHTLFQQFLQTIKTTITEKKSMVWDGLGFFRQDDNGNIRFVQNSELDEYLPPVEAKWINSHHSTKYDLLVGENETNNIAIEEGLEEAVNKKKSYWWVWAIVIAVVALAIIAYKYAF